MVMYISYLLFYPSSIIYFNTNPIKILNRNEELSPSSDLIMELNYCKYKDIPSHIILSFADGTIVPVFSTITNFKMGCHTVIEKLQIPADIRTDRYHLLIEITTDVNIIRKETINLSSESFFVKGGDY